MWTIMAADVLCDADRDRNRDSQGRNVTDCLNTGMDYAEIGERPKCRHADNLSPLPECSGTSATHRTAKHGTSTGPSDD